MSALQTLICGLGLQHSVIQLQRPVEIALLEQLFGLLQTRVIGGYGIAEEVSRLRSLRFAALPSHTSSRRQPLETPPSGLHNLRQPLLQPIPGFLAYKHANGTAHSHGRDCRHCLHTECLGQLRMLLSICPRQNPVQIGLTGHAF